MHGAKFWEHMVSHRDKLDISPFVHNACLKSSLCMHTALNLSGS